MSSSDIFISETIGTAVLILLGGGVCAAVTLKRSKAYKAGWVAIAFGWGFAVLTGAYVAAKSGAHLNPAVTVGIVLKGGEGAPTWGDTPAYFGGELLGAMIGAVLVWIAYYGHFKVHLNDPEVAEQKSADPGPVHGVFFTSPEIRNPLQNLATEVIATFVLVLAILCLGLSDNGKGVSWGGSLLVALVVVGIGLSLGGPTGYAINPVRDLGPRIVHALLPLPNKGGSDWGYAWVPVVGPLLGGAIAAGVYNVALA
ncbi:MIP/aquaporin family protein [Streptomyces sp. B-S-A8]|uniref:MIP/aquaporin family protein n=1 Tax=Streptomyces solicavernae TaxID=3043614 RepID=A0ABT6S0S4_9ACTN|nr:MIP/aquaporin family protein [Streptomyces sp. B-S-A8]MDI3390301.1 MIP/aquaporin family protein [Streptomyces sp. B-S-A8]